MLESGYKWPVGKILRGVNDSGNTRPARAYAGNPEMLYWNDSGNGLVG
jgi:hypothetical protein